MMEFTFDTPVWELALEGVPAGGKLSAARFLTMMERESEEDFEDALALLDGRDVMLDTSDLPPMCAGAELEARLSLEMRLVQEGRLPEGLEENDPLRLYLQELAAIPVCGDPQVLAQQVLAGDRSVQPRLMELMLSQVVQQAWSMTGRGVLLMDLVQEGSLGLWQAISGYRGGNLETQCSRSISRAMARAVVMQARESGVGQKMRQALEKYRAADESLLVQLGRNPTMEEIAQQVNMTLEEAELVAQMLDTARSVSHVKEAAASAEPTSEDQMAVEDTAYFQMRQRVSELLSALNAEDAKLVCLRYGLDGALPLTAEETGRRLGLTAAEVVAREAAALEKLRNN